MEHTLSSFHFTSRKDNWRVDYRSISDISGFPNPICAVYLNNELYWNFGKNIPYTDSKNPTKSQAKEMISAARKAYKDFHKVAYDRDEKLNSVLK